MDCGVGLRNFRPITNLSLILSSKAKVKIHLLFLVERRYLGGVHSLSAVLPKVIILRMSMDFSISFMGATSLSTSYFLFCNEKSFEDEEKWSNFREEKK